MDSRSREYPRDTDSFLARGLSFRRALGTRCEAALGGTWFGVAYPRDYGCSDVLESISREEVASDDPDHAKWPNSGGNVSVTEESEEKPDCGPKHTLNLECGNAKFPEQRCGKARWDLVNFRQKVE